MKRLRLIFRLLSIQRVLVRHGLDELIASTHLFRPLRFLFLLSPWTWGQRRSDQPRAVRIREALQELGPIYVKFGQSLSTRPDILPEDIAEELALLQDRVPPFSAAEADEILTKAYGQPMSEVFAEFGAEAMAAASIAQVHEAKLPTGEEVVGRRAVPTGASRHLGDADQHAEVGDQRHDPELPEAQGASSSGGSRSGTSVSSQAAALRTATAA